MHRVVVCVPRRAFVIVVTRRRRDRRRVRIFRFRHRAGVVGQRARDRRIAVTLPDAELAICRLPLDDSRHSVLDLDCAMVREDLRVFRQVEHPIFERRFVTRHLVAIPIDRKHYRLDPRAVAIHRSFRQLLAVAARVERAADESRQMIDDIKKNLLLLLERHIAQLDDERSPAHHPLAQLHGPEDRDVLAAAEVLAEAAHQIGIQPRLVGHYRRESLRDPILSFLDSLERGFLKEGVFDRVAQHRDFLAHPLFD